MRFAIISGILTLLLAGCVNTPSTPTPTAAPSATLPPNTTLNPNVSVVNTYAVNDLPTVTPLPSLTSANSQIVATSVPISSATSAGTVVPSSTSALLGGSPTINPAQQATLLASALPSPGLIKGSKPPLTIQIPADWKYAYEIVPLQDQTGLTAVQSSLNLAIYTGAAGSARATILVMWGFPSLGPPPSPSGQSASQDVGTIGPDLQNQMIYSDGIRLLRGTVADISCNIGDYPQQNFSVGGQPATGEYFAAAQCQGEPDTYGWFVGVNKFNTNFLFYVYVEPPSAINATKKQLQAILDTVVFDQTLVTTVPTTTPALH